MRLIDADALNGYEFGLISPYAQNLFHKTINEAPTIDYRRLLEQEPCTDAISREAVLDLPRIKTHNQWGNVIKESVDVEDVRQLPPVNPAEKVGHWRDTGSGQECSECGEIQYGYDSFRKYCANCGAKMEGRE